MGDVSRASRLSAFVLALLVTALLALAAAVAPAAAAAQSAPAAVRDAGNRTFTIRGYDAEGRLVAQGSGFGVVDGRVATSLHVIRRASVVHVIDLDGETIATVRYAEAVDEGYDLALLPAPAARAGLALDVRLPELGDPVWTYGSPQGLSGTMTDGIVSAVRNRSGRQLLQTTAPISAGSSGGPVLNADGRVVGITVSSVRGGQSLTFAAPARSIVELLGSAADAAARRVFPIAAVPDGKTGAGEDGAGEDPADTDPGERWQYIARNASDAALYYDQRSITHRNDRLRIWIYTLYPEPQPAGETAFDASKALFEFRCGAGEFRLNQYLLLKGDRVIGSDGSIDEGTWSAAAPDSVAERLLRSVCPRASGRRTS